MSSSVSLEFLCSVNTISDNFRLQLAPSSECHKLWCKGMALFLPVPQQGKTSAS